MAIDYEKLFHDLCRNLGTHPRDILGDNRFQFIHDVRLAIYYTLSQKKLKLLPREVAVLVQRDRTTVMYGAKRAKYRIKTDPAFAELVEKAGKVPLPDINLLSQ